MDGEIPLPPPRRIRHRSPALPAQSTNAVSSLHRTRRLSRFDDRSSQPSSDPALFSSDDVPASGLENYHAPTPGSDRKRRYRGTWWGEQVMDPKRKRRDFKAKRNVDSGVWMGSDESGADSLMSSESSAWGEDLRKSALTPKNTTRFNNPEADVETTPTQIRASFKSMEEPAAHRLARQAITDALERGREAFDLGYVVSPSCIPWISPDTNSCTDILNLGPCQKVYWSPYSTLLGYLPLARGLSAKMRLILYMEISAFTFQTTVFKLYPEICFVSATSST